MYVSLDNSASMQSVQMYDHVMIVDWLLVVVAYVSLAVCVCVCVCVCAFVVRHCTPSQPLDSEKNLQFDHSLPTLQHFCIQANLINELFPPGQQIRLSLVHVHVPISCAVV